MRGAFDVARPAANEEGNGEARISPPVGQLSGMVFQVSSVIMAGTLMVGSSVTQRHARRPGLPRQAGRRTDGCLRLDETQTTG